MYGDVDCIALDQDRDNCCCGHGDEPPVSVKCEEFFECVGELLAFQNGCCWRGLDGESVSWLDGYMVSQLVG